MTKPWREHFPWTHAVLRFLWPDRSARRKRWVVLAGVVLGLGALHTALTVHLGRRVAALADGLAEGRPLATWTLAPPPVPDADNAARAVRAATEMLVSDPKDLSDTGLDAAPSKVEELAATNALALALLDEAARRPAANWDLEYWRGLETNVPPLLRIMNLARLNAAAGKIAIRAGRADDALAAFARGAAIERSLAEEPLLIVQLVHAAVNRINAGLLREMVASGPLDGPGLERLARSLPAPRARETIHRSLVGETKVLHDSFSRYFGLRPWDGVSGRTGGLLAPLSWLLRPWLLEQDRACLESMGRLIAEQRLPRRERSRPLPVFHARPWHILAKLIMPNLSSAVDRGDMWEARESLMRLAVAIERHRTAEGQPPESLEALVPAYLDAVPEDPFGDGAPFVYRRTAEGWSLAAGEAWRALDLGPALRDPVMEWERPAPPPPKE
jgi:hypothetical protein